ncbi:MAG: hypothetical protein JWP94_3013 [Mucilaginibacter sp.]|jgi:hypothetical protein|nr:hypothetical protein [Mucilaginibacter sp.]
MLHCRAFKNIIIITFVPSCKRAPADLKKNKYHIVCSWILLACFIAGQYTIYAHQHNIASNISPKYSISKNLPQTTVTDKCALCDAMHHNVMVKGASAYFERIVVTGYVFKSFEYNFISLSLILSGGRAPPASVYQA